MIKGNKLSVILIILGIVVLSGIFVYSNSNKLDEISYLRFLEHLETGDIDTVYINGGSKLKVLLDNGAEFKTDNPRSEDFKVNLLILNNIKAINILLKIAIGIDIRFDIIEIFSPFEDCK